MRFWHGEEQALRTAISVHIEAGRRWNDRRESPSEGQHILRISNLTTHDISCREVATYYASVMTLAGRPDV